MWLHIPANVTLEDVSLEASDVLSIPFEDVTSSVSMVGRFQISDLLRVCMWLVLG